MERAPPTTLALVLTKEAGGSESTGTIVGLAVEDVEAAVEELRQANIPIKMEPQHGDWCWTAVIADPDGNKICLHHRNDGTCG